MLRQSTAVNKQRHPMVPIVMLMVVMAAGLSLAGCGGKNRAAQAGETPPGKELPAQASATQSQVSTKPIDGVKISVNQSGLMRVPGKTLNQVGFDLQAHHPDRLLLSLGGAAVPFLTQSDGSDLDIVFYGQPARAGMT